RAGGFCWIPICLVEAVSFASVWPGAPPFAAAPRGRSFSPGDRPPPLCSATQQSVVMATISPTNKAWNREIGAVEKRDLWSSVKRGFRGRCPRCGEGKLFRAFLKVDNSCSACGLDFTPHRADDLPAYLVIAIVGHIVVPAALLIETDYAP